jgi:outer membrane lipoprotein LolB
MSSRRRFIGGAISCTVLTIVSGCASVTPLTTLSTTGDSNAPLELRGRFAARAERNGKEEGVQGNFLWMQQGANVQLSLMSPLGQTLAIVTALPEQATLQLPNEPPRTAPEVDSLMQQALGFSFPVAGMRDWLQARPAQGNVTREERDASGRLSLLEQHGWLIRFLEYRDAASNRVPNIRRMDLNRTLAGEPLSVRLVIDD